MKQPLNTAACPRCTAYPCRCAYEPRPGFRLDDADVERIARRVVELFRRLTEQDGRSA